MKRNFTCATLVLLVTVLYSQAQEIQTVFKPGRSGGYGAISNKFTWIGGSFANMAEVYGGWYSNSHFLLGISAAGVTNDIPVSPQNSVRPGVNMSYAYGQAGLVTGYTLGSGNVVHLVFNLFSGVGFTGQYERWGSGEDHIGGSDVDENWFFVAEPGMQVEVNLSRWMRFSPGVSYRAAFGSDAAGLSDRDLSDVSYNLTLKFGKF